MTQAEDHRGRHHHLGLRARIALAVAVVSFSLSTAVSLTVYTVTRETLLDAREESASLRAQNNARQVANQNLSEIESSDLLSILSSLADVGKPMVMWNEDGYQTLALDTRFAVKDLPPAMVNAAIEDGQSTIMRFEHGGEALVAVGVPIPDQDAAFFEITELGDIEDALRSVLIALLVGVVGSTAAAALLGYWASRYTIRPITRVSEAAESVALGQLDTRLDYDEYRHDPDLAPLVANFNGMVQALQERINRDARFASDVSHELRSPLTTLNAGLQVLDNKRDEMPERSRQALDLLIDDVHRFTQLVEDLLEISRFDAGAVRLELDDVALVPMVQSTVNSLTHGEVPVIAEADVESLVIACDKRRLARILANFINNAAKYADGATHVSVERHDPDPDDPDHPTDEPSVRIAVEDAGSGVPENQRDAVFDRFNRGDQGGSRGPDVGVGLGLALAAEHARLQAGTVWVEDRSDGGQGARFVVELPLLEMDSAGNDEDDLSAATPESVENLTLTGEHRAIVVGERPPEFP